MKSGAGEWDSVEDEEGEYGPQKTSGLVTTNGRPSTFSKKAKERFP
jgi:hypothetical protein